MPLIEERVVAPPGVCLEEFSLSSFWQSPEGCMCSMFNSVHLFKVFRVLAPQHHQETSVTVALRC